MGSFMNSKLCCERYYYIQSTTLNWATVLSGQQLNRTNFGRTRITLTNRK